MTGPAVPPATAARSSWQTRQATPPPTPCTRAPTPASARTPCAPSGTCTRGWGARGGWSNQPGPLPIVEGTIIAVRVERLPGDRKPKPLWLWHSNPNPCQLDLPRLFAAFLRRFDLEHTFRFFKQTLGWTRPRVRTPEQADRWTWLILCAYTQLRLARGLAEDLRRPWETALDPDRLTPGRVRRGFPRIHRTTTRPAAAPKPTHPGPGRPKGSRNKHRAPRHPVGKQAKVDSPEPATTHLPG